LVIILSLLSSTVFYKHFLLQLGISFFVFCLLGFVLSTICSIDHAKKKLHFLLLFKFDFLNCYPLTKQNLLLEILKSKI